MANPSIISRLRSDETFAAALGERLRSIAASAWGPDTSHPDYADQGAPGQSAGQCYVTAMMVAQLLRVELGLEARVALGSLWTAQGRNLGIPFHGWVVIGNPLEDPVIVDLTSDQVDHLPPVLIGGSANLSDRGYIYHYQEVRHVHDVDGGVVGRWLALHSRADAESQLKDFWTMNGLDLSKVDDSDVQVRLRQAHAQVDSDVGQQLIAVCDELSQHYSFSATRTYPRPDHPDPFKRRSLAFLLTGILVSLRTTLENEQRAMHNVLTECPDDESLFAVDERTLAALIRPAGMPDKRARSIKRALEYCDQAFGRSFGALDDLSEDEKRTAVLGIPGFGPKAADCFLSIGLGVPTAVVDVNVFRSYAHVTGRADLNDFSDAKQVETVRAAIDDALPRDAFLRQIVHTLMLLYGKDRFGIGNEHLCRAADWCHTCPPAAHRQISLFG